MTDLMTRVCRTHSRMLSGLLCHGTRQTERRHRQREQDRTRRRRRWQLLWRLVPFLLASVRWYGHVETRMENIVAAARLLLFHRTTIKRTNSSAVQPKSFGATQHLNHFLRRRHRHRCCCWIVLLPNGFWWHPYWVLRSERTRERVVEIHRNV